MAVFDAQVTAAYRISENLVQSDTDSSDLVSRHRLSLRRLSSEAEQVLMVS
jgi:hypothetical protein